MIFEMLTNPNLLKMKKILLFILCFKASSSVFLQSSTNDSFESIKSELISWDPVRGEWLSSSIKAISEGKDIPDRTFPEDFTPYEMLTLVSEAKRKNILEIATRNVTSNSTINSGGNSQNWNLIQLLINHTFCSWINGRSFGDPHLISFDKANYSFQTVGEFVLSKSTKHLFEIQCRQRSQTESFSLNSAIAMNIGGDVLCFYGNEKPDENPNSFRLNGAPINLNGRTFYLPKGGVIRVEGKNYIVNWPTGERLIMDKRGAANSEFVNVSVSVFGCDNGSFIGLLGNANGNIDDDFNQNNSNRIMPAYMAFSTFGNPATQQMAQNAEKEYLAFLAKDFADEWRVTVLTTLFEYGFGKSTESYTDRSFPKVHYTVADLSTTQQTNARQRCQDMGIPANELGGCIFDLGHLNISPNPMPTPTIPTVGAVLNRIDRPRLNNNQYTFADGKEVGNSVAQPIANPNSQGNNTVLDKPNTGKDVNFIPNNPTPKPKPTISPKTNFNIKPKGGNIKPGGTIKPGGVKIGKGK